MRVTKILLVILGLALTLRLALALTYPHFWGVDGGASGETVNYWTGQVDFWNGFPKPPLAPGWLLAPFWLLLGADTGYKVWSALFAILPIIPVFLLTRKYVSDGAALFAAAFAAVDITWAEMFVTGSHPLVAFALVGMAFWAISSLYEWWSWKSFTILALSIGLIPWVNQTTAGLAIIVLPVFWLGLFASAFIRYKRGNWAYGPKLNNLIWFTTPAIILGSIIALGALPWYVNTLPGSDILTYEGPTWVWAWGWNTFQAFLLAFPLGLFVVWKAQDANLKSLGLVLITLGFMVNWLSYDEVLINPPYRARYFMALAAYPCIAWAIWQYALPYLIKIWHPYGRKIAWVSGAAMLVYLTLGFAVVTRGQNEYSLMLTRDSVEALQIATPGANIGSSAFALSLWVSALNQVRSPWITTAPPPPAYVQQDEDMRCVLNWLDYPCEPLSAAERLDIQYILAEERFPDFKLNKWSWNYRTPENHWERTAEAPWLKLVFERGSVKLWEIEGANDVHSKIR